MVSTCQQDRFRSSDLLASVIVPARDAGTALRSLIADLERQSIPRDRFEVVIGDDGSTDRSTDDIETDDGWIRVARGPQRSSNAARNRASRLARSAVLAFIDADCSPQATWLEAGLAAIESTDVVGGRIGYLPPARPSVWTWVEMDSYDQETAVRSGYAMSGNLFVRRDTYLRVGGFDDDLHYWGDYEFVARCVADGASLGYSSDATVWHPSSPDARAYLRRLWIVNEKYARYEAQAGRRPDVFSARRWFPVVPVLRSRRYYRKPLGLAAHYLRPSPVERLQALPILYLVNPYLAAIAKLVGWWNGRRVGMSMRH